MFTASLSRQRFALIVLLGSITACATHSPNPAASSHTASNQTAPSWSAACPDSAVIDRRVGPALTNQPVRCVDNGELRDTGHAGDIGAALRQTVPIIR